MSLWNQFLRHCPNLKKKKRKRKNYPNYLCNMKIKYDFVFTMFWFGV